MGWRNGPAIALAAGLALGFEPTFDLAFGVETTLVNPLWPGADPYMVRHEGAYYRCQAGPGGRIEVWKSSALGHRGQRSIVWSPPRLGWNTSEVWAPELHLIKGKWYIYYAASQGQNRTHRMGVLEAQSDDPQGPFIDHGQLYTGDDAARGTASRWAIDGTILEHNGKLFLLWSGWEDERDVQYLYIAEMAGPTKVSTNRVKLCANDTYLWERVGESARQRGLQEGPAMLVRNGRVFLVYSCSGSWQESYKLGMLWADASANLLDPRSWRKVERPVFQSNASVFGVGHCSFVQSPDGSEDWIIYHSKARRNEGWERMVRAQRFSWNEKGFPVFGEPTEDGQALAGPAGEVEAEPVGVGR
jgi:GH43 family beta-xylosidase